MKRKGLVLLVVLLAAVFAFTSCAKKEEVGVTDTEIVIGTHQDLSGPIAGWGTQVKMGMEMRVKEINDAGGIHGRKIRLIVEDSAYDPKKAIMVTNKMIEKDKVFCFIGNMGSPTAGATKPIISKKKIPQMFPLTAASLFYEPYDRYSFAGFVPYYDQARSLTKYFVEQKGKKMIGIMYQDDEMGDIMLKGVKDQLTEMNMELTAAESYKRGATDFSTQIANLKKAEVDFIVLATVIRETVGALKEANKLGWQVDMCGMSPAYNMYVVGLCMKSGFSADGFYSSGQAPYPYPDSECPGVAEWYQRHVDMFGKPPDLPTTAGYAGIDFFQIAAEKVGKDLTREKLIDTMETMGPVPDRNFCGVVTEFTKTDHKGARDAQLFQVQNNRWVKVADISF
jgi:ABC-type branched-subunit amino acid transport system substrate-binding protein